MTPEESIARLSFYTEPGSWVLGKHDIRAIQQGIEALKLINRYKETGSIGPNFKLPGETEE